MSPFIEGKKFPYDKAGFAKAALAKRGMRRGRSFIGTSDGMMLGKGMAKGIVSKMPKVADIVGGVKSKMPNANEIIGGVKQKVQDTLSKARQL